MRKILFIGSNPSQKSNKTIAFWTDTSSRRTLDKWLLEINDTAMCVYFLNVHDQVTVDNRPLKVSEIKASLNRLKNDIAIEIKPNYIVTLGKTAEKALLMMKLVGVDFYAMPHPSGLNRQLNDQKFVQEKIKGLQNYLKSPKN